MYALLHDLTIMYYIIDETYLNDLCIKFVLKGDRMVVGFITTYAISDYHD